jgi:hypothetical protein
MSGHGNFNLRMLADKGKRCLTLLKGSETTMKGGSCDKVSRMMDQENSGKKQLRIAKWTFSRQKAGIAGITGYLQHPFRQYQPL